MKAFQLQNGFGIANLVCVDLPDPTPDPGQVLVQIKAVSLNYRDLLMIEGHYNPRQPLPLIPLSDGAGEVVAVGPGVTRFSVGDRVMPIFAQKWLAGTPDKAQMRTTLGSPLDGTLCQLQVFDADGLVATPAYLNDEEAATLPCAAVTAWNALVTEGNLRAGQTVLAQGTGGVSIFALQIAKAFGAKVWITSSSDDKLRRAKALGADECINYRTHPDWDKLVLEQTQGQGVDHVIEVGGADTLAKSLACTTFGGNIAVIGILSGLQTPVNLIPILMNRLRVQGIYVGHRQSFEEMLSAFGQNRIHPVVDRVFPFAEAPQALQMMKAAQHFGKIVITPA